MNALAISAIIPAYNEEKTIGPVVKTLVESGRFREVIVVSDASKDRTAVIAKENGAIVYELTKNSGKAGAMKYGLSQTDAPILFMCDADLFGFTIGHIDQILEPVLNGSMALCVGLRDRGAFMMKVEALLPLEGGERALRREVFESVPASYIKGFMSEPVQSYYCRSRRLPYGSVPLFGLKIRRKMQKVGIWKGFWQYIHMGWEIGYSMLKIRVDRLVGLF